MDNPMMTPATLRDALARQGLVARPLTLTRYTPELVAQLHRTYDAYERAAAELGWSVPFTAGIAGACCDILVASHDESAVTRLRPLIATEPLSVAETIARADTLLTYLLAERAPLSA